MQEHQPVYDALIISDGHLGAYNCQGDYFLSFLQALESGRIKTKQLIINGDLLDSYDLHKAPDTHIDALQAIRRLSLSLQVIIVSGNHDGPPERLSNLIGLPVVKTTSFESGGLKHLVVHGDQFDTFTARHGHWTWLGDCIYAALQHFDKDFAHWVKIKSKIFLHCIDRVETGSTLHALQNGYNTVICGHTHYFKSSEQRVIHYFNSGCWVEKLGTYLVFIDGVGKINHWPSKI